MSDSGHLLVLIGRFLDNRLSFAELVEWIEDREEYWASLPNETVARVLAGAIMLTAYEVDAGHRSPDSLREILSEASLQPASKV